MKRVLILVEGQTEERFVKGQLQPHLWSMGVAPQPKIATTKRVKAGADFKGGVISFSQAENDLRRLLNDSGAASVTTLLDFYAFPRDFKGWQKVTSLKPLDRVRQLELALEEHFNDRRFCAYLMLHEFEAMLFSMPEKIAETMNEPRTLRDLRKIRNQFAGAEEIDDGSETAPSKRLKALFPRYQKPLHGPLVIGRIGLETVRAECPHFNEWLTALENLGRP